MTSVARHFDKYFPVKVCHSLSEAPHSKSSIYQYSPHHTLYCENKSTPPQNLAPNQMKTQPDKQAPFISKVSVRWGSRLVSVLRRVGLTRAIDRAPPCYFSMLVIRAVFSYPTRIRAGILSYAAATKNAQFFVVVRVRQGATRTSGSNAVVMIWGCPTAVALSLYALE